MADEKKLPDGKLDVKLIALDLDDTLLNDKAEISERNVEILRKAAEKGIYIVLCSGRAENGILPFVRRLDLAGKEEGRYIVAFNGCSIFDLHQRLQIHKNYCESDIMLLANKIAKKYGLNGIIYSQDAILFGVDTEWTRKDGELCGLKNRLVDNFEECIKAGSPKMLIPGEPETLELIRKELVEKIGNSATVFFSKPFFLEVLPPDCGKGDGIKFLADKLGFSMDKTMSFGDSMNDEDMIRKCGFGVAMCNGKDYIKEIADFVTEKSNDESGVADFIEKWVL